MTSGYISNKVSAIYTSNSVQCAKSMHLSSTTLMVKYSFVQRPWSVNQQRTNTSLPARLYASTRNEHLFAWMCQLSMMWLQTMNRQPASDNNLKYQWPSSIMIMHHDTQGMTSGYIIEDNQWDLHSQNQLSVQCPSGTSLSWHVNILDHANASFHLSQVVSKSKVQTAPPSPPESAMAYSSNNASTENEHVFAWMYCQHAVA